MDRRARLAFVVSAPLLAGCASLGLDPWPDNVNFSGRSRTVKSSSGKQTGAPAPSKASTAKKADVPPPPPALPTLALKFERGAKRSQTVSVNATVNLTTMGMSIVSKQQIEFAHETVDVGADGNGTVNVSMTRISADADNPMSGPMKYDSGDPESIKKALDNPMVAQELKPIIDSIGKVTACTVTAAGVVAMKESAEGGNAGLKAALSGGNASGLFTGMPGPLSQEPLAVGLSWKFRSEGSTPMGDTVVEGTAKVDTWDPITRMATLSYNGALTIKPAANPDPNDQRAQFMASMKMKTSVVSGTTTFDQGKGRLVAAKGLSKIVMQSDMMGGDVAVDVATESKFAN